jgi:hypothetical protein
MANYAEFLKANGATDDEIKVLVTPASEKAYNALQTQATEAITRATKAESDKAAYDKWYKEVAEPTAAKALSERDQALADAAAERARLKKLQDLGLVAIAEQMGEKLDDKEKPPVITGTPDMSKYVDRDTLLAVAAQEGDAIATAQDIAFEHQRLLPDKPLNFRELRKRALDNKRSVYDQLQSDFNVPTIREQKAAAEKTVYETKLREEGASAERAKLQTANPNLVTPVASTSPFTGRAPSSQSADAQPWNKSEAERESTRLQKGISKVLAVQ